MSTFFLTFLAVALAMIAGREAVRVARISASGAGAGMLLVLVTFCAVLACALAAWLAGNLSDLFSSGQRSWFVAAALVLAALEVAFLDAPKVPTEPTRSLGAIGIVLFAGILTDASGLLVLSMSVAGDAPVFAGLGGALAAAGVLGFAVMAGEDWERLPRKPLRLAVAGLLAFAAIMIGFDSLGGSY